MTNPADTIAEARRWLDQFGDVPSWNRLAQLMYALLALAERAMPEEPTREALIAMDLPRPRDSYRALYAHLAQQSGTKKSALPRDETSDEWDGVKWLSDQMAEDEGIWFIARTAAEAYLQDKLRKLCASIDHAAEQTRERSKARNEQAKRG